MNKRSPNFSNEEIERLIGLVTSNKGIIECKKSDIVGSKRKEDCWKNIEKEFNIEGSVFRSFRDLRKKYENIKSQAKKTSSEELKYTLGTGGGPAKKSKLTDTDMAVIDILQPSQVKGIPNQYDTDYGKYCTRIW